MNTTATSLSSEHSWMKAGISRRSSMESILSIQSKETEFVRDTSDTDWSNDPDFEYEPVTEPEDEAANKSGDTSSDNDIIATKVVAVAVCDDGDMEFADSEQEPSLDADEVDSEIDRRDYWHCVQCGSANNNPLYRYCEKCFKVRKSLFPPRPKRKCKRSTANIEVNSIPHVHLLGDNPDSGVESNFNSQASSQEFLSQDILTPSMTERDLTDRPGPSSQIENSETSVDSINSTRVKTNVILDDMSSRKRRAGSIDRRNKRIKTKYSDSKTDSESEHSIIETLNGDVKPLVKSISDPALSIDDTLEAAKKSVVNTSKEKFDDSKENLCIVCFTKPKSGVFVHGRIAHICCCYKCAVKVWTKLKRCPVCNSKVSNVLKAVVM